MFGKRKLIIAMSLISACMFTTACINDDEEDNGKTLDGTASTSTPVVLSDGTVVIKEVTLTCVSECKISANTAATDLTVDSFQGNWEGALGTKLKFTGFEAKAGTFTFTDPKGNTGSGSFLVKQGQLTLNISVSSSYINVLQLGVRTFNLSNVTNNTVKLDLIDTPVAATDNIEFKCISAPCNSAASATAATATNANFVGAWNTVFNGVNISFTVAADSSFTFSAPNLGSGKGTFSVSSGKASITVKESTISAIGLGSISFKVISVSSSAFSLEVIPGSANLPETAKVIALSCSLLSITTTETIPNCGRANVLVTPGNVTDADMVGEWIATDKSSVNISFVVKTLGAFTISDISGKTATGTYTVANSTLSLTTTASTISSFPVGTKAYPISKVSRQDLVLNIP